MTRPPVSALLVLALTSFAAGNVAAAEVTVENFSNGPIFVCFAFNKGQTVSDGWTKIEPNGKKVFNNDTRDEMFLRIESNKRELRFPRFNKFLKFPANDQRFVVKNEPDDNSVRTFRWGAGLEHSVNKTKSEPLPAGWDSREYFSVGSGNDRLEVKP